MKFEKIFGSKDASERESKFVEKIESLPMFTEYEKASILLVLEKLKPATLIGLDFIPVEQGGLKKEDDEFVENLLQTLRSTGLCVSRAWQQDNYNLGRRTVHQNIVIASSPDDLNTFMQTWEQYHLHGERSEGLDSELGNLFGIPKTAVDAYAHDSNADITQDEDKQIIYPDQLPDDVREQEFMAFANFTFSKDFWQEEIKTVQNWADQIKRLSPKIYDEVVREYKKRLKNHTIIR